MKRYIFDVDGTLTAPRRSIDEKFAEWFCEWAQGKSVYLVTGSDRDKTREQLGEDVLRSITRVYNCLGNDVWESNDHIRTTTWKLPEDAHTWLSQQLTESGFELRTGIHFEHRPGMVNFSIVGRGAEWDEREQYIKWDQATNERVNIAGKFNSMFPSMEARVGGDTGIDITERGADKSQILADFDPDDGLLFFGDDMDPSGNDYTLYRAIVDEHRGFVYTVKDYNETWNLLQYGK
jgi:phosphomannomutase